MTQRRSRRGLNAVEFALMLPALSAFALGFVDFGWYFARQVMINNALSAAVRAGSAIQPDGADAAGDCADCLAAVRDHAVAGLADLGITVDPGDVTPTIEPVAGTCALVLDVELTHETLVGLVPLPDSFHVPALALAQNVNGC